MSIEIDIATGDATWPAVKPLLASVWPPDVVKAASWGHIVFAHADLRAAHDGGAMITVGHEGIDKVE